MKSKLLLVAILLGSVTSNLIHATSGPLFAVHFNANDVEFEVVTTIKNHNYPCAGLKVNSPGFILNTATCDSVTPSGYCKFDLSSSSPKFFTYTPLSELTQVDLTACLNVCGAKPLSCQQITNLVSFPGLSSYFAVGSFKDSTLYSTSPLSYSSTNGGNWILSHILSSLFIFETISNPFSPLIPSSEIAGSLKGLFCDSTTGLKCTAVGQSFVSGAVTPFSEVSTDGGNTWSPSTTDPQLPTGIRSIDIFKAISCFNNGETCVSAGSYYSSGLDNTLPVSFTSTNSGGTWSTASGPAFTLPSPGTFFKVNGMSCTTTGSRCTAVGSYINATTTAPISYSTTNTGAAWSTNTVFPDPPNAIQNSLQGVACNTSDGQTCVAVGSYLTSLTPQPVSYYSTNGGSTWSISTTLPALPSGATMGNLYSVSCNADATDCIASGDYTTSTSVKTPVTYLTNDSGVTWAATTTFPILPTANSGAGTLSSIFCDSNTASSCTAVGFYGASMRSVLSYHTTNQGVTWTDTSPSVSGNSSSALFDISCNATDSTCATVGEYNTGSTETPLIYSSTNSGETLTLATNALNAINGRFNNISCFPNNRSCTAVGAYFPSGPGTQPLSAFSGDAGQTWSKINVPLLPNMSEGELFSVDCEDLACTAVGNYSIIDSLKLPASYVSTNGGFTWNGSAVQPVLPGGGSQGSLSGVSCGLISSSIVPCVAVGSYYNGSELVPLAYSSSDVGNTWQVSSILPQPPSGAIETLLDTVVCSQSGVACVAAGMYLPDADGNFLPVLYTSANSGLTWSSPIQVALPPLGGAPVTQARLNAVACNIQGTSCLATGFYTYGSVYNFTERPLSYISNDAGQTWTISPGLPLPPANAVETILKSLTCDPTLTTCSAVGSYYNVLLQKDFPISYLSTDGGKNWRDGKTPTFPTNWLYAKLIGLS